MLGVLVGLLRCATALGTVPSMEFNRRWVWSDTGGHRRAAQVIPFSPLSLVGLALSGRCVGAYPRRRGANVSAYGALWLVQFALCDRVLFGARFPGPLAPAGASV